MDENECEGMDETMVLGSEELRLQLERLDSYNSCYFIPLSDRRSRTRMAHSEDSNLHLTLESFRSSDFTQSEPCHDRSTRGMHDPDWLEVVGNPTIPHVQSLRQPPANVALPPTASSEQLIGVTNRNASRRYLRKLQKDRERNQEVLSECMGNLPIVISQNASRRYLRKLQKDRERNQEVLSECMGNLPIVIRKLQKDRVRNQDVLSECMGNLPIDIRQLAYPESPPNKTSARSGVGSGVHSADKKFRIGRLKDDFWPPENSEQWTSEDIETESAPPRISRHTGSEIRHQHGVQNGVQQHGVQNGRQAEDDSAFVRHAGFVGVGNQASTLKYRFGKKKAKLTTESAEGPPQTRSTFRPKGFGALYDELEFERRYKKVFDLNKHIHFVHSNFVTGQRISKRAKLPPIGHNPSVFSDPTDGGGDIFAIMSVQKYNYPPDDVDSPQTSLYHSSPNVRRKSEGSPKRQQMKRHVVEIPKEVDGPIGFVPGAIPKTGQSPFDGVHGVPNIEQPESELQLPLWIRDARPEETDDSPQTERSVRSMPSIPLRFKPQEDSVSTGKEDSKSRNRSRSRDRNKHSRPTKKTPVLKKPDATPENKSDDEGEPFNISVHVNLRPRDPIANLDSDFHRHRVYPGVLDESPKPGPYPTATVINTTGVHTGSVNNSPDRDTCSTSNSRMDKRGRRSIRKPDDSDSDTYEEKILYPTRLPSRTCSEQDSTDELSDQEHSDHVIWPKNITTTTNQYGISSQKVKYPDRFMFREALEEEDETAVSSHGSPVKMLDGTNKVPKLFADPVRQPENKEERQAE